MNKFIVIFIIFICSGCTNSLVTLPELPKQTCPEPEKPVIELAKACPSIAMPEPIPKTVYIRIKDGNIDTDEGGEKLIREYAATRKAIKQLWHEQH